jgi:hypothetical protein
MKDLPIAVALVLASLAVVGGVVFGLGDDDILVSPPETVAQEFVRAMAMGQVGSARGMLTRDAERRTSESDVRRISADCGARIGRVEGVEATEERRRPDTTLVRVLVEGERGRAASVVTLAREFGAWAVVSASDVLPAPGQVASHPSGRR